MRLSTTVLIPAEDTNDLKLSRKLYTIFEEKRQYILIAYGFKLEE